MTKEYRGNKNCPFLLLENSRPLSPPWGPLDFLSICLRIDSLITLIRIATCIRNLEKWYRGTCLQGGNRDAEVESRHVDGLGGRGV